MSSFKLKVLLTGVKAVDKTSLIKKYTFIFRPKYKLTVGVGIIEKDIEFRKGEIAKLSIWNIEGQQRFEFIRSTFYKGAAGAILVFDLTREETYIEVRNVLTEIRRFAGENMPFLLLGDNIHLLKLTDGTKIRKEAREFAETEGGIYIETSPTSIDIIEGALQKLTLKIIVARSGKTGEYVEDLIMKNRKEHEKLDSEVAKETREEQLLEEMHSIIENKAREYNEDIDILHDHIDSRIITPRSETSEELTKGQAREIDQRFGKIQSKIGDIRHEKEEFLSKRNATKKLYYKPIFSLLETENFKEAATKYYDLAETIVSRRRDLKTSSLLILLHGLCLIKVKESYSLIRESINQFLNRRGVNKRLLEDTYDIMLILFIIDVKAYNLENYLPKVKGMLEILPLFEEELELIDI
ncbi:MAG: hypothetical protein ACFE8B_14870 [Candidatus Hermodarchaeota archaeon]